MPRRALILLALALAACSDKSKPATDSSLARDLALAGSQAAVPTFQDTAVGAKPAPAAIQRQLPPAPTRTRTAAQPKVVSQAPAPQPQQTVVQQAPTPTPAPAPAPATKEIGAGSSGVLTTASRVCTSSLPGDKLVATLTAPITGTNGAVFPAGSSVVIEVASVTPGSSAETTQIAFRVRAVVVGEQTYQVAADVTPQAAMEKSKVANPDPGADKRKVVGGAIAGAILGQMIGHNTKGTVIGAATGAAAGAVAAKAGEKWEGCLPAGSAMKLTLTAPVVIS